MDFLEFFNPLRHFSQAEYVSFWQYLFSTILSGFWARLIASVSIIFSFWFGVYRRRPALGALLFGVAVFVSYFGSLIRIFFWWF